MPLRRTAIALLAGLALSTALVAGCSKSSNKSQSTEGLPDAATLVKQSQQTTSNLKSAHVDITVTGTIEGFPIKTLTGDLTNTPAVAAKGHTKVSLGGDDADVDFVVLDGTLYGSLDPGIWNSFGPAVNVYDVSTILNPSAGLANVLANLSNPKTEGQQTINGVNTVEITGDVTADTVKKIAPKLKVTGNVSTTVWIRADGNHDLVQAKLEPSSGNSIQMTLSNWNQPVNVEKPPGV
ncbi:MAG TPA: LppX_LprAFG lipoprotein [Mycobacterium sp.]|nr:LppX_LprAFG lipoprotein [Mycobacterium sp.]